MSPLDQNIEYCRSILPKVSRTFAPTIRMLPGQLNLTVMVAYLLCRIADTVEDEKSLTKREKQEYEDDRNATVITCKTADSFR